MFSAMRSLFARRRTSRPLAKPRGLSLERLEAREVPAISVLAPFGSPTLTINADTNGFNNVLVFRQNNAILGPVLTVYNNNGQQISFVRSGPINNIVFNGSANGDVFRNSTDVASTIFGNGGNDTLIGGTSLDTISGGAGDDAIDGGDTLFPNILTETADANFTLANPSPSRPGVSTMTGLGNDLFLNITTVRLTGTGILHGDVFDVQNYTGSVVLQGGPSNDLFRLGSGLASIDGGDNGSGGDAVVMSNVSTALFDRGVLFARGTADTIRNIESLTINGTGGNDTIDLAGFGGQATVSDQGGDDIIRGGTGNDILDGGLGNNIILPSGGNDVTGGNSLLAGIVNGRLTPSQLSAASGPLRVVLRDVPGHKALDVFGPTGAGFTIEGNWVRSINASAEVFTLTGSATLKTALGDLPIVVPSSFPLTFETALDPLANFGTVTRVSWNSPPPLTTRIPGNPLSIFKSQYGLDLSIPNANWGVALGRDIPGSSTMPINPAVPYLFITASSGYSASFGGLTASTDGVALTVVFDPSDPSLFVRAAGFDVAVSAKGYIPYKATQALPANTPAVYGNLAAAGSFDLGGVPVTIGGGFVVDFDANDDGFAVGVTPDLVNRLITGQSSVKDLVGAEFNDIAFGINGTAGIGYSKAGFNFSVNTAAASLVYTPGTVAFAGGSLNPLAGTPLAFINPGSETVSGTVSTTTGDFDVTVSASLGGLLGTFVPNEAKIHLTNEGVFLSGKATDVIGVGRIDVSGAFTKDPVSGAVLFDLFGSAGAAVNLVLPGSENLPTGPINIAQATLTGSASLTNRDGPVTFTVHLGASIGLGADGVLNFRGSLSGDLIISVPPGGGLQFVAAGSVSGTVNNIPFVGSETVGVAWTLSNNQFTVDLGHGLGFSLRLNSPPAFQDRSITEVAKVGGLVTLSGRITEVDPGDKFILDVDWGDGTTKTYTFPAGSDGKLVEVTHRYDRPSPTGEPYLVTAIWHDPQGAGNSAIFTVDVVKKDNHGRDLERASDKAIRRAEKLGVAREVRTDFDGDGVADVLALQDTKHGPRLYVVSGRTGEELAHVDLSDAGQTVTLPGAGGKPVSLEVSGRRKGSWEVITFRDPTDGEQILRVAM